jgi:hypothetical protein
MFDHLADPAPPRADAATREAVADRAGRLTRRRAAARRIAAGTVAVVTLGVAGLLVRSPIPEDLTAGPPSTVCCPGVEGTVTDQVGVVARVAVLLVDPTVPPALLPAGGSPPAAGSGWRIVARGATAEDGTYRITGVAPGRYAVRFEAQFDPLVGKVRHAPVFLGGTEGLSGARLVDVGPDRPVRADQRLELSPNHGIRGSVREPRRTYPVRNIAVRLYADGQLVRQALTDDQGRYDLGGLRPGAFRLAFVDETRRVTGQYPPAWAGGDGAVSMPEDRDLVVDVVLPSAS